MKSVSTIIIGISGGSGSGKTTFARQLLEHLGDDRCAILAQDHYYIDQSAHFKGDGENVNFDHPSAIDFELLRQHLLALKGGNPVEVPIYDFVTHTRQRECTPFACRSYVILDGTLILSQEGIRECLDHSVFIEAPERVRFERRMRRDTMERGRLPEGVRKQFVNQVKPMHDQFVEPSRAHAHFTFSGLGDFRESLSTLLTECFIRK